MGNIERDHNQTLPLLSTNPTSRSNKAHLTRCLSLATDELKSFRSCLRWMCVDQSNAWRATLSWFLFFLLAVAVPICSHFLLECAHCTGQLKRPYDGVVQLSLSGIATLSFVELSWFVKHYGLRRFLFLDKLCRESETVRHGYTAQLDRSLVILSFFVLPCFIAEAGYKVWWYVSGASRIPFLGNVYVSDEVACTLELSSWLYRTSIFFLACVLFRMICYLQILRLQDFAQIFHTDHDVQAIFNRHLNIRSHLKVISHRYRRFIIIALLLVTTSPLAALLITTRSSTEVGICTAGEIVLCSVTLVAGLFILMRSATKVTHKAQSVTCLAAKWHICATLQTFEDGAETSEAQVNPSNQPYSNQESEDSGDEHSSSDGEEELDKSKIMVPPYAHTVSFQKRQALVTYLENNLAGITAFGIMLDRSWLQIVFGIHLSLLLWLLDETVLK